MGGNIFQNSGSIKKEDIEPTLAKFYETISSIFPNAKKYISGIQTLGSVGKKDVSGDIDLAISGDVFKNPEEWGISKEKINKLFNKFKKRSRNATENQLMKKVYIHSLADKIIESGEEIDVNTKGSSSGVLFMAFPQYDNSGKELPKAVQIDLNIGNLDWLKFAYYSSTYKGNVKGLHRTQLLLSLFTIKNYVFSHNYGVKNKETQEIEASNPKEAIQLLNKIYGFKINENILEDYYKLHNFLKKNLSKEDLKELYDTYLKILDKTRADIPKDLQNYWIKNQDRLGLKGKFLPDNSNLIKYKTESMKFSDHYFIEEGK